MPNDKVKNSRLKTTINFRIVLGVILITVSVLAVWGIIQASQNTEQVLIAKETIVAGQTITTEQIGTVDVKLYGVSEKYLKAEQLSEGSIATETIAAGELLPERLITTASQKSTTTVAINTSIAPAAAIVPGSTVMVWLSDMIDRGEFAKPEQLTSDAVVVSISETEQLGAAKGSRIELSVPKDIAPLLLHAQASGAQITILEGSE